MTADAGNPKNITPGPKYGMVLVYVFLILVIFFDYLFHSVLSRTCSVKVSFRSVRYQKDSASQGGIGLASFFL